MLTTFKGTGFPDRGEKKFPWKKFLVIPKSCIFSFEIPFKGENPCIQGDFRVITPHIHFPFKSPQPKKQPRPMEDTIERGNE